jgi:Na+/H+ antiporter NhaD/arsenite permease-like protein
MILIIAVAHLFFLYKKRYKLIISKYEQENENQRKKGNRNVWVYVITSVILMILVAFYKPGKL